MLPLLPPSPDRAPQHPFKTAAAELAGGGDDARRPRTDLGDNGQRLLSPLAPKGFAATNLAHPGFFSLEYARSPLPRSILSEPWSEPNVLV